MERFIFVIIYASGYASTRQMTVESSAIQSDFVNTPVYSNAFVKGSSEKLPLLSVKAVKPIITSGIMVNITIQMM